MAVAGGLLLVRSRTRERAPGRAPEAAPESVPAPGPQEASAPVPGRAEPPEGLLLPSPATPLPLQDLRAASEALLDADREEVEALVGKLSAGRPVGPGDLRAAERLLARHSRERGARSLLEGVFLAAAGQARGRREHASAAADLRRASGLLPESRPVRSTLLAVLLEAGDWSGAEAAARDLLALAPDDPEGTHGLAYALIRQDRSREAGETLRAALDRREDPVARALLGQIQAGLGTEKGMTEQRLAYFNVRYDGEAHEDVGREILRQLERHRATLVRTFDHEPAATIAVILFSRQGYYDATGAPAWAGGHYDSFDGRIRIPIGGLTSALTPEMDGTLIHELTHAFIADRSRGVAPRDLHEGIAQFMEGKRLASLLPGEQLKALADGRIGGVAGFYLGSLSFAEFLMAERGQGGINDLLQALAEGGDVDAAFRRVYGRTYAQVRNDWATRLRRDYGS
ncbi:MAG TPA: tetratricopeptide repeat protein [Vicinamibacteria bacterium]|nr:tetratricopeptide repeat protein [Vicinamibacteria bacterium]